MEGNIHLARSKKNIKVFLGARKLSCVVEEINLFGYEHSQQLRTQNETNVKVA